MNLRGLTDEILLQQLKADDALAFKEIYTRYWKLLFDAAYRRLGNKEVARELVQTIFLRIWEKRHTIQINHLHSYLQTAIRNSIINHIEHTLVHKKYLQHVLNTAAGEEFSVNASTAVNELSMAIDKAINLLPEKTRHVFRLSRVDHLSIREIAASLNISEKAVEYHITQSLKLLRVYLKEYIS